MTIQEAIKSGKRFGRPDGDFLRAIRAQHCMEQGKTLEDVDLAHLNLEDILANDWEVEEEKVQISRSQLEQAFKSCSSYREDYAQRTFIVISEEALAIALGFKS